MQGQRSSAEQQLLICDFELDGEQFSGRLHEFGVGELIVDTGVSLPAGTELEVRLIRSPSFPEIWLDVSVAEELIRPTTSQMEHRFRLRILSISPEYLIALGAYAQSRPRDTDEDGQLPLSSRTRLKDGEAEWIRSIEMGSKGPRRERPRKRARTSFEPPPEQTQAKDQPAVVVIDAGELDDVVMLLEELGVDVSRTTARNASELDGWVLPRRLLVTTPRLALALRIPRHDTGENRVSIAIGEIESATLHHAIQRQDFQYVVRRPVHPEALRLLLLQAIYRGHERRQSERLAIGCEVDWSLRWRRRRDPMVEISMNGCRLLTDSEVPIGPRVKIRVPPAKVGGKGIALRGHVVRCESVPTREGRERFVVAVAFEPLRGKRASQFEQLLAFRATGPATLDRSKWTPALAPPPKPTQIEAPDVDPAESLEPDSASGASEDVATTESPEPDAPDTRSFETDDRRSGQRSVFRGEVVALASDVDRVLHTLVGRDLSRDGLRVEAHPLIALGDHIRVGLYDASAGEPLIVEAVVARDDGSLGLWLGFEATDADTLERIDRHQKTLTPIQSLHTNDGEVAAESVVFANLFETEAGARIGPAASDGAGERPAT
jgi:hypothetical protein